MVAQRYTHSRDTLTRSGPLVRHLLGRAFIALARTRPIRGWDLLRRAPAGVGRKHRGPVRCLSISRSGHFAVTGARTGASSFGAYPIACRSGPRRLPTVRSGQ
jgi:hypothetical protein